MKFKQYLIEQSNNRQTTKVSRQDVRKAIQQGQVDSDIAPVIRDDARRIIRRHIKGDADWRVNQWYNDIGLTYIGDDLEYANTVVDGIVGDIFGYFQDGPKSEITRVMQTKKQMRGKDRTVYKVVPRQGKTQIQFFRVDQIEPGEPALGVLIL